MTYNVFGGTLNLTHSVKFGYVLGCESGASDCTLAA